MPVSIPLILETTTLAIDSCDTMNLDTGDISNVGKSTAAQTNLDSKTAQTNAIEASSETFKTLGDLTQLIIPIKSEFVDIVARVNAKLAPYEAKVVRADNEFVQIADSEAWYVTNTALREAERDAATATQAGLDPASPTYSADAAAQQSIIDIANAYLSAYATESNDLANSRAEWQTFRDYHQAVVDDIINTFNTIMSPVRSAFSSAKSAIETSNSNISNGKDQMLDGAAAIAKTLAKTASAAVTQAIGDIAENSNIMPATTAPAGGGGDSGPNIFKNERQLRASSVTGTMTNVRFDVSVGQWELIEEPTGSSITFGNSKFSIVRVMKTDLEEFFGDSNWSDSDIHFFLSRLYVDDPRFIGESRFAPRLSNGNVLEYNLKKVGGGASNQNPYTQGDDFLVDDNDTTSKYYRFLIYHTQDQGYPNTHNEILVGQSFGPIDIYNPTNWYFGYVDAYDVENIDYLPWEEAKAKGPWGGRYGEPPSIADDIFISQMANLGVASDYHHDYLKPNYLDYVVFGGQPAYRIYFERNSNNNNGAFSGHFNKTVGLVVAQKKTAEELALEEADLTGTEPFIAKDDVLTYNTFEKATSDVAAGIYKNERLIRINNFRRSEGVGLGELFIVKGITKTAVNEWEEAWRVKTGTGVDVESHYKVINNVIGLRKPPLDVEAAKPNTPDFEAPPTSKTITLGDRTLDLGSMNPVTDLISGADAFERATKAHFEDITPFLAIVENSQDVATKATAGLGGFDEEKVNAKKIADAVADEVKKEIAAAETAKDDAKFDFAKVTQNMTSVAATNIASSVKSAANTGTSLMSNARTSTVSSSSTAFPQNEQLIARAEPPIQADPYDITSGGRIPS